jgi:hypothetical protein
MPLTPEILGNWILDRTPGLNPPFFLQITGRDEQASADLIVDLITRPSADPHDCFLGYANDFDAIFVFYSPRNKNTKSKNELHYMLCHPDCPHRTKMSEFEFGITALNKMIRIIKETCGRKLAIIDGPLLDEWDVNLDEIKEDTDQLSIIYSDSHPDCKYSPDLEIVLDYESKHEWYRPILIYRDDHRHRVIGETLIQDDW